MVAKSSNSDENSSGTNRNRKPIPMSNSHSMHKSMHQTNTGNHQIIGIAVGSLK